ncbi:MAG: HPr(Ser) kinase/phosphatase, partial [Acidobacteriota bacterium]
VDFLEAGRVQVLGSSEMSYLALLGADGRRSVLERLCQKPIACLAVTENEEIPRELIDECEAHRVPLLRSRFPSSVFIDRITLFLDSQLAPRMTLHGVLMDVFGVGVLIMGKSGVGKSECALDLVVRGHRLVSDDVVEIRRQAGDILLGRGPELIRHHMELRGLGIINIEHLFGAASIRSRKRLELVVVLEEWKESHHYERLGLDQEKYAILDVELPLIHLPVAFGRNPSILIEVAVRNMILKLTGYHPAEDLSNRLREAMERPRFVAESFDLDEGDFE